MSLWCPYIKANYCFLWSCNKYILRHPVAKGADCFQERPQNHVLLATGKGPRQPRVFHPAAHPRQRPLHQLAEKHKGLGPCPRDRNSNTVVVRRCQGRLSGGRPAKSSVLLGSPCHVVSQLPVGYQLQWLLFSK